MCCSARRLQLTHVLAFRIVKQNLGSLDHPLAATSAADLVEEAMQAVEAVEAAATALLREVVDVRSTSPTFVTQHLSPLSSFG